MLFKTMPGTVVNVISLIVAVTVSTLVYYAWNAREQLQDERADAEPRRRRRLSTSERIDQQDHQNLRDFDNPCGICTRNIQNTEWDLTTLPCNHNFHCRCISDHLRSTAVNDARESTCPICQAAYSFENIF